MRCPKCGFHSFDYLDSCKKCGRDLLEQKLRCKFQGYVTPVAGEGSIAPAPVLPEEAEAESEAIDFGFDILADDTSPELPDIDHLPTAPADIDSNAFDFSADNGLSLDQPFAGDEKLPDDDLPKLDDRFDF